VDAALLEEPHLSFAHLLQTPIFVEIRMGAVDDIPLVRRTDQYQCLRGLVDLLWQRGEHKSPVETGLLRVFASSGYSLPTNVLSWGIAVYT
jgi:hypothetical protein